MSQGNFTKILTQKQIQNIVFITLNGENGVRYYAYMAVRADKLEAFAKVYGGKKAFNPEDYGKIIHIGEGMPTEEVRQYMSEEYGFDHENPWILKNGDDE